MTFQPTGFIFWMKPAFVWNSLDGATDVKTVAANLSQQTKSAANEDIVWLAIDSLKKDNLLDVAQNISSPLDGMNCREVIRKIGLTTIIALPVVSSLIAPRAANAQSACGGNGTSGCIFSSYTQSSCCSDLRCTNKMTRAKRQRATPGLRMDFFKRQTVSPHARWFVMCRLEQTSS